MFRQDPARTLDLSRLFDRLGIGMMIFEPTKNAVALNQTFRKLIERDPESERVLAEALSLARAVLSLSEPPKKSVLQPQLPSPSRRIRTSLGIYELRAGLLQKDLIGADRAALVSLVRSTPSLPTVDQLRMLFRLGFQEATIALLLAEGRSNKDIAKHLGIRLSTVRTHVERIFRKMGVQSRKALGLLLLRSVAELSDCE